VKVGAENRTKLIVAISLAVAAVVLLAWQFGGWFGGASSSATATAAANSPAIAADPIPVPKKGQIPGVSGGKGSAANSMDPALRLDLLRTSEDTKYEGAGRNIFRVFIEQPKPVAPVIVPNQPQVPQGPPPPAPPPPINLVFYGFATPAGGAKRIFLAQGEDVFIAREGDIVDRRYKVVRISPNAVEILDVLSNNRQSIPLTQG
jgi:hypothetical protein